MAKEGESILMLSMYENPSQRSTGMLLPHYGAWTTESEAGQEMVQQDRVFVRKIKHLSSVLGT